MVPRFGTDGLRGVANSELSPELVMSLGRVAALSLPGDTFIVGADTRRSSPMLKAALAAGIASGGNGVCDVGVIPTPGLAWLAASRGHPGAMVSASHNPFFDNGIKLVSSSGIKLDDATEAAIELALDATTPTSPAGPAIGAALGAIVIDEVAVDEYVRHLTSSFPTRPSRALKVVCDCANGAASALAARVYGALGFDVEVLFAEPNGVNINDACGSTHPEALQARVLLSKADVGLGFDGDADRMIAVAEDGSIVDGDHLIALFALDLKARGELANSGVVVTVLSNLGLRQRLAEAEIAVIETPVGDRYVADALVAGGFVLGGEQSGHIIFRQEATTGDGLLTGLKLLELLGRTPAPLSALRNEAMTRFPQVLTTVPVADPRHLEGAGAIWSAVAEASAALKGAGRVLVRGSGTEAAVRVMVEADSAERAEEIAEYLVAIVRRELA